MIRRWLVPLISAVVFAVPFALLSYDQSHATANAQLGPGAGVIDATAAAGSSASCPTSVPSAGNAQYIVWVELDETASAAVAGTAPNIWTASGIGSSHYYLAGALAAGATDRILIQLATPVKGASATAVTFTSPATANIVFHCAVMFYTDAG